MDQPIIVIYLLVYKLSSTRFNLFLICLICFVEKEFNNKLIKVEIAQRKINPGGRGGGRGGGKMI